MSPRSPFSTIFRGALAVSMALVVETGIRLFHEYQSVRERYADKLPDPDRAKTWLSSQTTINRCQHLAARSRARRHRRLHRQDVPATTDTVATPQLTMQS